jgi:hypothetical protein
LVGWQGHHDDLLDEIAKFDAGPGAGDSSEDSVTRRRKDEEERIPCVSTSPARLRGERIPQETPVLGQHLGITAAELLDERRRNLRCQ